MVQVDATRPGLTSDCLDDPARKLAAQNRFAVSPIAIRQSRRSQRKVSGYDATARLQRDLCYFAIAAVEGASLMVSGLHQVQAVQGPAVESPLMAAAGATLPTAVLRVR